MQDTTMKHIFYPMVDKSLLFEQQYIMARSGHSRGSTVDLTLVDEQTGKELDMGSPFDWFGIESHPDYMNLTEEQIANHDHTAENIFSNSIDTWKNVANVQFIDNVGSCFSAINGIEEQFNQWVMEVPEALHDVQVNPDNYEGSTIAMKDIHSTRVRTVLAAIHNRRCWLRYAAATLRYFNLQNMNAIGIPEQEVMDFTTARENKGEDVGTPPSANRSTPMPTPSTASPPSPTSTTASRN